MIDVLPAVASTAAALGAERMRLEIIAQNIANANTTRGLDGKPYQRQVVQFQTALQQALSAPGAAGAAPAGPEVSRVVKDPRPGRSIYQPGHPDADADGMVALPNVNLFEEMADMIVASRTYEANLAVLKNGRQLALQTLSLGKH